MQCCIHAKCVKNPSNTLRNRESYMRAHFLLNLFKDLRKSDKMRGLTSILSLFSNKLNKFNNTRA